MNFDDLKRFLFNMPGARLEFPFGQGTMVFKVMGKMFALLAWESDPIDMSLKCAPTYAVELRRTHYAITPAYHLNKMHWNTIHLDGTLEEAFIYEMIQQSYDLVVSEMPKRLQREVEKVKASDAQRRRLLEENSSNESQA